MKITDRYSKIEFHWESVNILLIYSVNTHTVPFYLTSHSLRWTEIRSVKKVIAYYSACLLHH